MAGSTKKSGQLSSNQELYEYLADLGAKLSDRRAVELSRIVLAASRTAAVTPVTEFLGESRIALRRVENEQTVLTDTERRKLLDLLQQLEDTFNRR